MLKMFASSLLFWLLLSKLEISEAFTDENYANDLNENINELTDNFFANLRADPFLLKDTQLGSDSKEFIQNQVANYINLMKNAQSNQISRSKRSITDDLIVDYVDITPYKKIPARYPKDIQFFQQNSNLYSIVLESPSHGELANSFVILRENGSSFIEVSRKNISNGASMATFQLQDFSFIVVAENRSLSEKFEENPKVYKFTSSEELEILQTLESEYANDISIWETQENIFMVVTQYMSNRSSTPIYEVNSKIYKWTDSYFDVIQEIPTAGAIKAIPFTLGVAELLAVVNSRTDVGSPITYSEILRYIPESETYEPYRRILTRDCTDIKAFSFKWEGKIEHFLVTANSNTKGLRTDKSSISIFYKYVDDGFIPFHSIEENGILQWEPAMGKNGELALFAVTHSGNIKIFHYDGWRFEENKNQMNIKALSGAQIMAVHFEDLRNVSALVVVKSENPNNDSKAFQLKFSHQNNYNVRRKEILDWCQQSLETYRFLDYDEADGKVGRGVRGDIEGFPESLHVETTTSVQFDVAGDDEDGEDIDVNELLESLQSFNLLLENVEERVATSLQSDNTHIIDYELSTDTLILNNDAFFNSLVTDTINGRDVEKILSKTLNINEGFKIDTPLHFEFLRIDGPVSTKFVNGHPVENLVHTYDNITLPEIVINKGNFLNGLQVTGEFNEINISDLLLTEGDQTFTNANFESVVIQNLNTKCLNELEVSATADALKEKVNIKEIPILRAKKLLVGEYLNDIDLQTLDKYALRTDGDQTITQPYFIEQLNTDNIDIKGRLSDKKVPESLVLINEGKNYKLAKDVLFLEDPEVNNLIVKKRLNNIPVRDGKLAVLLKKSDEVQYISGHKKFQNLQLVEPIKLRGNIESKHMDAINPVVTLDNNITITGNVTIKGNVTIEELLWALDVAAKDENYTLLKVERDAVKLTDTEIPVHMKFVQQLNVNDIFVDKINGADPQTWVVNGKPETQIISGAKRFEGNLEITGSTSVFKINDINIPELERSIFTRDTDQIISAKHHIKYLASDKRIIANNVKFGPIPWTEVMTISGDETISGTTIIHNDLIATNLSANSIEVAGLMNDLNFTNIVNDVVTRENNSKIQSHKTFKNLTIDVLNLNSDLMDANRFIDMKENEKINVKLKGDVHFGHDTQIKEIHFTKSCNGIDGDDFSKNFFDGTGTQVIYDDMEFDQITIYGKAVVGSGKINDVKISSIVEDTVKIDEPYEFGTVEFHSDVIAKKGINLDGHIDNFDIDNIVESNSENEQVISGKKIFSQGLTINGSVTFNGLLNGFNVTTLCKAASPDHGTPRNLTIKGNAVFQKNPDVYKLHGIIVEELWKKAWLNDRPTTLTGYVEFGNVTFKDKVNVTGYVDNVRLEVLAKDYFSKTKNQTVSAKLDFVDGIIFTSNVSAPLLKLEGSVNDIVLEEFVQTVLLNDVDQVFEDGVFFEEVEFNNLQGEYLVNGMNLENDVMRYDKINLVTGPKIFKHLDVDEMKINKNIKIQDVDILDFLQTCILKTGSFNIPGTTTFTNVTFANGLTLKGTLNGQPFDLDHIMVKSLPQNITGKMTFIRDTYEPISFKSIKLKGLLNDIDFTDLVNTQAYKDRDNIFKSEINFYNDIHTKDLIIKDLYQGVNISELLSNISSLGTLNNFVENYYGLLDMAQQIEESLKNQAYFLHYYKTVQHFQGIQELFIVENEDALIKLNMFSNSTDFSVINSFVWDERSKTFVDEEHTLNSKYHIGYVNDMYYGDKYCFYVENIIGNEYRSETSNQISYTAKLLDAGNLTEYKDLTLIASNGTQFVTSFTLPHKSQLCLLYIEKQESVVKILCEDGEYMYVHQVLPSVNAEMVTLVNVNNTPYLTVMNKHNNEDPWISTWKYLNEISQFHFHQVIYEYEPKSIASVCFKNEHYIAIASGYVQNTMYFGRVTLKRYNKISDEFETWQTLNVDNPTQVTFSILPSDELVLYILTNNPTKPLIVYVYEGISGFVEKIVGSELTTIRKIRTFSTKDKHFIAAKHTNNDLSIIEAVFKGDKWSD